MKFINVILIIIIVLSCSDSKEEILEPGDDIAILTWQVKKLPANNMGKLTLAIVVNSKGDILVGQNDGRIFRSVNGDTTWNLVKEFWYPISFMSINEGDSIFAGYYPYSTFLDGGVSISHDNGETWADFHKNDRGSWDMNLFNSAYYIVDDRSIAKSLDKGETWHELRSGLEDVRLRTIAIDQTNGFLFVGSWGNGVYRSTDNGLTWSWNGVEGAFLKPLRATGNGYIFASTGGGIYRTENHGESWQKLSVQSDTLSNFDVNIHCIYTTSEDYLLIGTDKSGLFLSMDYGDKWHYLGLKGVTIFSLHMDKERSVYVGSDSLRFLKSNESLRF